MSAHGANAASAKMTVAARIVPTEPETPPLKERPAAAALPANDSTISATGLRITNSNSSRPRRPGHADERGPDRRGERRREEQDGDVDRGVADDQLEPDEDRGEHLDQGDQHRQRRGPETAEAAGAPGMRDRRPERVRRARHHRA